MTYEPVVTSDYVFITPWRAATRCLLKVLMTISHFLTTFSMDGFEPFVFWKFDCFMLNKGCGIQNKTKALELIAVSVLSHNWPNFTCIFFNPLLIESSKKVWQITSYSLSRGHHQNLLKISLRPYSMKLKNLSSQTNHEIKISLYKPHMQIPKIAILLLQINNAKIYLVKLNRNIFAKLKVFV